MAAPGASVVLPEKDNMDKQTLLAVLQFLKKNNLKDTESLLKQEANISDADVQGQSSTASESAMSNALAAYKREGDPCQYEEFYSSLKSFVEASLDVHKCELAMVLYPVFVHMYLELVYNGHEPRAVKYLRLFGPDQEEYYQDDVTKLSTVTKPEHMVGNQLMDNFKTSKYVIRMSRDSYNHLKRHLQETKQNILLNIVQEHMFIDVFDGVPRNKQQIDATSGGMIGEARRDANKVKVFYGLLKEPDINVPLDDEEEGEGEDKPKKKKAKKDMLMKKSKNDPNAPSNGRIPLPELRDCDKMEKIAAYREALKCVKMGPENPPTVCIYTLLNAYQGVTAVDMSEDCSLLAAGLADSHLRVFTLTPGKLRRVKPPKDLKNIDREADDVLERMMDDRTGSDSKLLVGHAGPVYAASFNMDKNYLVSSSEDGTARLWSLQTWTNLVCYKGHNYPVWDVKFSPHGHYFASCGHDRTARLWSTDHHQPVRIFAGHLSDVDSVQFHPNSNYIATGSTDRTVRVWDVLSGNCVRIMTGHKGAVHSLAFSPDGKHLASAGTDATVLLWDLAAGDLVGQLKGHKDTVYSLAYSRDGTCLASGGLDQTVHLWQVTKLLEDQENEGLPVLSQTDSSKYLIGCYPTKSTPVLCTAFTRRNLLLASGPYVP